MTYTPKVLIIDDEIIIHKTLESLLAGEKLELISAINGRDGLALAQQILPDAILLDVMMPGLNGYETCRQLRRHPQLAEVPIIMITALDDREAKLTGLEAGADDFLSKPFDGIEIRIRIKNIVRLNRYRRLVDDRSRFFWMVEQDEQGYLWLNEEGNIQYANQRAQNFFHLPETYIGLNFNEQFSRYYESHTVTTQKKDSNNAVESFYLVQPETPHARAFWLYVEQIASPLDKDYQRLVRVRDMTEKISTQHDMRKFHTLVTHKLRTPVTQIYSSLSILETHLASISIEEVQTLLRSSWKGSQRLLEEVQDILNYYNVPFSMKSGEIFKLRDLCQVILTVHKKLEIANLNIILNDDLEGQALNISSNAMELVVYEILENAKKFHPQHSPTVEVRIEPDQPDRIRLRFLDDGLTLTSEQITWAQQPYFQGEKSFTGETPGMGLGLPLVASLIWQFGGQVRLTNREYQTGVCVDIIIPTLDSHHSSQNMTESRL